MKYTVPATTEITKACFDAVALAKKESTAVEFEFNGVDLLALPQTDPLTLVETFYAVNNRRFAQSIELTPKEELRAIQERLEKHARETTSVECRTTLRIASLLVSRAILER